MIFSFFTPSFVSTSAICFADFIQIISSISFSLSASFKYAISIRSLLFRTPDVEFKSFVSTSQLFKADLEKSESDGTASFQERQKIFEEFEKVKDKRRNVLKLKEQMTCTADMEFEVKPRNLLVKELGV